MSITETLLAAQPQRFGLWPSVWKLLRLRALILWNGFKRAKLRGKISTVIVVLVVLAMMGFLFWLSGVLLRFMRSPALANTVDPAALLRAMPTLVLTAAFFTIVLTNFGVLLQSLYLSRDMDFLVTTPLPMRAVFIAKLLEAILPGFALFSAISLPVLIGMAVSSGYSLLFYPLLLLVLAVLALAAGGLAAILVMAVVRVFPARRVAEVLGFIGAMSTILCGQSGNIYSAMRPDSQDLSGMLVMVARLDTPWSPLAWAGRGLEAVGRGDWLPGLGLSGLTLLLAAGLFTGTLFLAEQLYYTGWASMQGSTRKKRARAAVEAGPRVGSWVAGLFPRAVWGIIVKDLRLLRRDPRNLSQLITPLIVGFAMLFSTRAGEGGGRRASALSSLGAANLEMMILLLLGVFVGWMLMFNLASMAFSREGRSYWLLKASPVKPRHLLAAKFIIAYLPSLLLGAAYLASAYLIRGASWGTFLYAVLALAMIIAGATGISLAFGAAAANLNWDSPQRQRLRGATGCMAFPAVLGYEALALALFLVPPVLWQIFTGGISPLGYGVGGLLGSLSALLAIFVPLKIAAPRLARLGEEN